MSRLDGLVIIAHDALNACGLGAAAEELIEHCRGATAGRASNRAWLALGTIKAVTVEFRAAVVALRDVDMELGIDPETFDPCTGTAGVCA